MASPPDLQTWLLSPEALADSPSRADGVSAEEERKYRRRTVMFMEAYAKNEEIDWQTLATAQTFFHYFFAKHSFRRHERFHVLMACLFLAGKVEECPKAAARNPDVLVRRADRLWFRRSTDDQHADAVDRLAQLKQNVLACERTLLHAVGFDLIVPKPHPFLMEKIKLAAYDTPTVPPFLKVSFGKHASLFLKFAMRTSLCLQVPPSYLAAAAAALSAAYLGLPVRLPGASAPVQGTPIEPLPLATAGVSGAGAGTGARAPAGLAGAAAANPRATSAAAATAGAAVTGPPLMSGSPLLAGGSPAVAPGSHSGGDESSPSLGAGSNNNRSSAGVGGDKGAAGNSGGGSGSVAQAAAAAAAAAAVWQQVVGPMAASDFGRLAAQVLEAFKWNEAGDAPEAATPRATALEARLTELRVLTAAAAAPGPRAAGPRAKKPRPPPPPPGAPPPGTLAAPAGEQTVKRAKAQ